MKISLAQISVIPGDLSGNFKKIARYVHDAQKKGSKLVIFPELTISGYLIGDLWENEDFLRDCLDYHHKIAELSNGICIVFGSVGIDPKKRNEDGRVRKYNALFCVNNKSFLKNHKLGYDFWPKSLSPNYREFDESRYFYDLRKLAQEKGTQPRNLLCPLSVRINSKNLKMGVFICEDIWDENYCFSPTKSFLEESFCDFVISINSSPYTLGKNRKRHAVLKKLTDFIKCPIIYLNCIGVQNTGKSIYGFDGSSSLYSPLRDPIQIGGFFSEALLNIEYKGDDKILIPSTSQLKIQQSYDEYEDIIIAIEYILKTLLKLWQIRHVVIGVSGGIDSSLSACLFSRVLESKALTLVNMPTRFNSEITKSASRKLAKNLDRPYRIFNIEEILNNTVQYFNKEKLELSSYNYENLQARTRGSLILATLSSVLDAVFPCNVNKTELTVGYGTLYGDLSGFLSPLGDLWKNQIYALAKTYNDKIYKKKIIPEDIFQIPSSAELSEKQDISKDLGDPLVYDYHDALFKTWVESWVKKDKKNYLDAFKNGVLHKVIGCPLSLVKKTFECEKDFLEDYERWWKLFNGLAKFKRVQAPPIISVSKRSFGNDLRESLGV